MGNEFGNPASKLCITALAVTTPNIEKNDIDKLYSLMIKAAGNTANADRLSKEDLVNVVLKGMDKFTPSDSELFIQLFTLFDEEGQNKVDCRDFVAGAGICLTTHSVADRLKWGMSIYDKEKTQTILRGDLKKLLMAVNSTAAYFGDPVLAPTQIDQMTLEMFKALPNSSQGVKIDECVAYLLNNDLILQFINGDGVVRFGDPELN